MMFLERPSDVMLLIVLATGACGPARPPADFAPDPGLAARIESIRVRPAFGAACPGGLIRTTYSAVLNDGTELPFETRYDEDDPPALHVIMLRRISPEATSRGNGDWDTDADPMRTVMNGYRLNAFLKVKPSASGSARVEPEYSCLRNGHRFTPANAPEGAAGLNGLDLTVRIGIVTSPFYERLLVAGIEVGVAPPFYVLADANLIPPADWLALVSQGGRGGRGVNGSAGVEGQAGAAGCPGGAGGAGGAGSDGGAGGPGGRGGRMTVFAPIEEPFLAGLVDGQNTGGKGGKGGEGGEGGAGGVGGAAQTGSARRCVAGEAGAQGGNGADGPDGPDGPFGPPSVSVTVPLVDVFGPRIPPALADLLDYSRGSNRQ